MDVPSTHIPLNEEIITPDYLIFFSSVCFPWNAFLMMMPFHMFVYHMLQWRIEIILKIKVVIYLIIVVCGVCVCVSEADLEYISLLLSTF